MRMLASRYLQMIGLSVGELPVFGSGSWWAVQHLLGHDVETRPPIAEGVAVCLALLPVCAWVVEKYLGVSWVGLLCFMTVQHLCCEYRKWHDNTKQRRPATGAQNSCIFTLVPLSGAQNSCILILVPLSGEQNSCIFTLVPLSGAQNSCIFTLVPLSGAQNSCIFTLVPLSGAQNSCIFTLVPLSGAQNSCIFTLVPLSGAQNSFIFTLVPMSGAQNSCIFTLVPLSGAQNSCILTLVPLSHSSWAQAIIAELDAEVTQQIIQPTTLQRRQADALIPMAGDAHTGVSQTVQKLVQEVVSW